MKIEKEQQWIISCALHTVSPFQTARSRSDKRKGKSLDEKYMKKGKVERSQMKEFTWIQEVLWSAGCTKPHATKFE